MSLMLALAALQGFAQLRDGPLSPGQWSYRADPTGSEARFGAIFSIRCERATRRVRLARTDSAARLPLRITTDTLARSLTSGDWLDARDPLLDAIAFSRGRFLVEGGGAVLRIPVEPEAARSIEDCRN